jgi:type VI protein secretion system component VasK
MHRDTWFQKNAAVVDTYGSYLVDEEDENGEEEVATIEWS